MYLLASREYPVIDYQTMAEHLGCERLFRAANGALVLHMSSDGLASAEERIIWLTTRDALTWLNQGPDEFGSYWEFSQVAPAARQSDASGPRATL